MGEVRGVGEGEGLGGKSPAEVEADRPTWRSYGSLASPEPNPSSSPNPNPSAGRSILALAL